MLGINDINEMRETIDRQNRIIAVLKRTAKQWVKEYNILDEIIDMYKMSENEANEIIAELKAENEQLKEEVETRDNLVEHFRKEAINWAKISNNYIKDIENYKQTLQEIKKIVEYIMTSDTEKWTLDEPFKQIEKIIELTKAEEE